MNSSPQHPTTNDPQAWKTYWKAQGQPWRTEPEIDAERQKYLAERRAIVADIEKGIYPFKGIKLSRADVEWLLATHEDGRGPVDWSDENQRQRRGLDLRGADLRRINLRDLPLARLCAGLAWYRRSLQTLEQLDDAAIYLEGADLRKAHLEGATLRGAHLERADLGGAFLEEADLSRIHLEAAHLRAAHLNKAILIRAHLEWTDLPEAYLQNASLSRAHLEGAHLRESHLEGADLRRAFFDLATNLDRTFIANAKGESILLAGIHWGDADLTMLDWGQVKMLGDERMARQQKWGKEERKDEVKQLLVYKEAVRANRQLVAALQSQGHNEDAARFAYRAQKLQQVVLRRQKKFVSYLFSCFLDLLAGYGYRPIRSVIAYLVIIFGFMGLFLLNAHFVAPHLRWDEALVLSVSSFHGRGFFTQDITLGDTYARLAAVEAVIGLFIEISFIATFTKRFFGS